jgi:hypothetical protein
VRRHVRVRREHGAIDRGPLAPLSPHHRRSCATNDRSRANEGGKKLRRALGARDTHLAGSYRKATAAFKKGAAPFWEEGTRTGYNWKRHTGHWRYSLINNSNTTEQIEKAKNILQISPK